MSAFDPLRTSAASATQMLPDRYLIGVQHMRRVLIMLDVTEAEAGEVVNALVPVSPHFKGLGVKEAFEQVRSVAPQGARGILLQIRSRASGELGGPDTGIAYQEVG